MRAILREPTDACRPRDAIANRIAATAQNDSQNPAAVTAHGSTSSTSASAHASTSEDAGRRPPINASATTPSIHIERCAGTLKPASAA